MRRVAMVANFLTCTILGGGPVPLDKDEGFETWDFIPAILKHRGRSIHVCSRGDPGRRLSQILCAAQ